MPTLFNNAASITLVPKTFSWVEAKLSYADNWQYVPYVVPVQCVDVAAPEVGYADFQYDFGLIKREDRTTFGYATTYGLLDYYVRIMVQNEGYGAQQVWVGIVTDDETTADRPGFSSGEQKIRAYQLTHLLDREPISTAWVVGGDGELEEIHHVPTFNKRSEIGLSLDGNRSENEDVDGVYVFGQDGEVWTNLDIVKYLCQYHKPANLTIELAGQFDILDQATDLWDFEGYTLWDALNRLIDRKRGLGFYPWAPGDGTLYLWVFTLTERDIQFGPSNLAANPLQTFYEFPSARPYTHLTGEIPFRKTTINQYDTIKIRGVLAKATATFSKEDGSLDKGWGDALATDYADALGGGDATENGRYRTQDKFKGVFTRFIVPETWNGLVGDGEGGQKTSIRLKANKDGTMEAGGGASYKVDRSFLRETPFQVGKDYSEDPATDGNPADTEPEFMPILVLIKSESIDSVGNPVEPRFHFVDRLDESMGEDEQTSSAHVRPLDKQFGVELSVSPQHLFATFEMLDADEAESPAVFDYDKLICTATIECDERPTVTIENFSGDESESSRTLIIDVPNAEYWYVAPGTVFDIDAEEPLRLKEVSLENNTLRDDKAKLEAVAAFVTAWYGVRRQAVQIPLKQVGMFVQIGTLLTDIRNAYFSEPVRTVVTGRKIDFIAGVTVIETGYNALDIATSSNIDRKRIRKGRLG